MPPFENMKTARTACLIILLIAFFLGGCDRTVVLSSKEDGSFRFQHLENRTFMGISNRYLRIDYLKYGIFRQTVHFPYPWWEQINLTARLPSDERAWLIANYRTGGGGFHIGLLQESTGANPTFSTGRCFSGNFAEIGVQVVDS